MAYLSDKAKASLDKAVQKFQSGDLSAIVQVTAFKLPDDAPASKWSWRNRVMAFAQSGSLDCRGFRQWKQVDRSVKKGELAAFILRPRMKKNADTNEKEFVGVVGQAVFGYNQTDGDENSAVQYEPRELPPLMDVAERLGISVEYQPTAGAGHLGRVNGEGTDVTLGTEDVKTWFHELAHACHARIQDNGELDLDEYDQNEVVAEFTATVLMEVYGFGDRTGNAWKYIEHYSDNPLTALNKALGDVEKVLGVIENA